MGTPQTILAEMALDKRIIGVVAAGALVAAAVVTFFFAFNIGSPTDEQEAYDFKVNITIPGLGTLEGKHKYGAVDFYGVPYAKQPSRFQHAREMPEPWGHRAAFDSYSAPICVQGCFGAAGEGDWVPGCPTLESGGQSEQCLNMQIAVPERYVHAIDDNADSYERLPVIVYLHGGGFTGGSGHTPIYDGKPMAAMGDVIVIAVNYRLGVFGYGPFPETWNDQPSFGNFGLTDQQMALKFVNEYIEYFGGDKNRVTLSGQSAGAESTYIQLVASGPHQKWFDKVMAMSPPLSLPYLTTDEAKVAMVPHINEAIKRKTDGACDPAENPECVYDTELLDTRTIYDASREASSKWIQNSEGADGSIFKKELFALAQSYQPIVDGNLLVGQMVDMSKDLMTTDKPVLWGSTGDEGELFVRSAVPNDLYFNNFGQAAYEAMLVAIWKIIPFGPIMRKGLKIYPWDLDCERLQQPTPEKPNYPDYCMAGDAANSAVRDYIFLCPQRKALSNAAKNGGLGKKAWFWYFDEPMPWVPPENGGKNPQSGYGRCHIMACHGGDISYVFNTDITFPNVHIYPEQILISRKLSAYITNFARNGDPNLSSGRAKNEYTAKFDDLELENWPEYNDEDWGYMRFNSTIPGVTEFLDGDNVKVIRDGEVIVDHKEACEFWDDLDKYGHV